MAVVKRAYIGVITTHGRANASGSSLAIVSGAYVVVIAVNRCVKAAGSRKAVIACTGVKIGAVARGKNTAMCGRAVVNGAEVAVIAADSGVDACGPGGSKGVAMVFRAGVAVIAVDEDMNAGAVFTAVTGAGIVIVTVQTVARVAAGGVRLRLTSGKRVAEIEGACIVVVADNRG